MACPLCAGRLAERSGGLQCASCQTGWPYRGALVDFRVPQSQADQIDWRRRQDKMDAWYDDLLGDPEGAVASYVNDYEPIRHDLGRLSGTVLDLGGGVGVTRHYLSQDVDYVNLDPSTRWLSPGWRALSPTFPTIGEPMCFVLADGERMPLRAESFDAVLVLWSLNHASSPERVIAECWRVLKPSGQLFMVMEDMEPRLADLLRWRPRAAAHGVRSKAIRRLMRCPWPIQPDHRAVGEGEILEWTFNRFLLERRAWTAPRPSGYLGLSLRKR